MPLHPAAPGQFACCLQHLLGSVRANGQSLGFAQAIKAAKMDDEPGNPALTLLDMPESWVVQLPAAVGPEGCLALLGACKKLRDLMMARGLAIKYSLPVPPEQAARARATLRHATDFPGIGLSMEARPGQATAEVLQSCMAVLPPQSGGTEEERKALLTAAGSSAVLITQVQLTGMELHDFVPSWLITACPRLRELHHTRFTLPAYQKRPEGTPKPPPGPPNPVQVLRLTNPTLPHNPQRIQYWKRQLRALKSLKALHLSVVPAETPHPSVPLLTVTAPAVSQITFLSFSNLHKEGVRELQISPPDLPLFPRLFELQLPNTMVDGLGMQALLQLPRLTYLTCRGFELQPLAKGQQPWACPWQLAIEKVDLRRLSTLPQGGLQASGGFLHIIPHNSLEEATRVVAEVAGRGGLRSEYDSVLISHGYGRADSACVRKALELMPDRNHHAATADCNQTATRPQPPRSYRRLSLMNVRSVDTQLVETIHHLARTKRLKEIIFRKVHFTGGALQKLLDGMPHHISVWLLYDCMVCMYPEGGANGRLMTEADLAMICQHAGREVSLNFDSVKGVRGWPAGWKERAQQAMAFVGRPYVRLVGNKDAPAE